MIALDASAALEMLLRPGTWPDLEALFDEAPVPAFAPHPIDIEVAQVLRRLLLRREISRELADDALNALHALPVERCAHGPLLDRIWLLKDNLTAYDAAYVALAEKLGATLWTLDKSLANAAGLSARVRLF